MDCGLQEYKEGDGFIGILSFIFNVIVDYFILLKWKKLYKKIGVQKIYSLNNHVIEDILYHFLFWRKKKFFNATNEIIQIKYNNIKLGDLIYDTYIRFYKKHYYNQKSQNNINKLLFISKICIKKLNNIIEKEKFIHTYIPQLSSAYIQYGLPIRCFLNKKINVLGCDNSSQYIKKFNQKDHLSCLNYNLIKKKFQKLSKKKQKINYAKKFYQKNLKVHLNKYHT